ncbi:hypothetical protein ACFWE3_24450 [Mycobacteriaceae bacterium NPDC060252]
MNNFRKAALSFEGRIAAALFALAIAALAGWSLIHYENPVFAFGIIALIVGVFGIRDAVKTKRAGELDGESKTN